MRMKPSRFLLSSQRRAVACGFATYRNKQKSGAIGREGCVSLLPLTLRKYNPGFLDLALESSSVPCLGCKMQAVWHG